MGKKEFLNKMNTVSDMVDLGDKLDAIITLVNELKSDYNDAVTLLNEIRTNFKSHVTKTGIHYDGAASVTDSANDLTSAAADTATSSDVDTLD